MELNCRVEALSDNSKRVGVRSAEVKKGRSAERFLPLAPPLYASGKTLSDGFQLFLEIQPFLRGSKVFVFGANSQEMLVFPKNNDLGRLELLFKPY